MWERLPSPILWRASNTSWRNSQEHVVEKEVITKTGLAVMWEKQKKGGWSRE